MVDFDFKEILVPGSECCLLFRDGSTSDVYVNAGGILFVNGDIYPWHQLPKLIFDCRLIFSSDYYYDFSGGCLV